MAGRKRLIVRIDQDPGFHRELVDGRVTLIGCPKLDDAGEYVEKPADLLRRDGGTITAQRVTRGSGMPV
jgi:hypothetical protein